MSARYKIASEKGSFSSSRAVETKARRKQEVELHWMLGDTARSIAIECHDSIPCKGDGKNFYEIAQDLTWEVGNRRRFDEAHKDRLALRIYEIFAHRISQTDLEKLPELARVKLVEVRIPYEQEGRGWAARIFPWEDVLTLATRKARGNRPLVVIRHLVVGKRARKWKHPIGVPTKGLFVSSAPGTIKNCYSFRDEAEMVGNALGFKPIAVETPTLEELKASIDVEQPEVVHLTGVDVHQATEFVGDLPLSFYSDGSLDSFPILVDGFLMKGKNSPYDCANAVVMGEALAPKGSEPYLVSFNCFYSAARLAALAVANGAGAAIGFQDTVDDAVAELFFDDFYRGWRSEDSGGIFKTFEKSVERLRGLQEDGDTPSVVLWSARSIFDESAVPAKPPAESKPASRRGARPKAAVPSSPALDVDTGDDSEEVSDGLVRIKVQPCEELNYALLYNQHPLFRWFLIRLERQEGEVEVEVEVILHAGGIDFPFRARYRVCSGLKGKNLASKIRVPLVAGALRECRENLSSCLFVAVTHGEKSLYRNTFPVKLLSADEWDDSPDLRKWLPSLVFPRDPAVTRIIDMARRYLCALLDSPDGGFDGYQSQDPENTEAQVKAIWMALLLDCRLLYVNPPPTYTKASQRLRTPTEILGSHSGTCIDLALLFAACLEYVGIYPAIFLCHGHALPAYWSTERKFQELARRLKKSTKADWFSESQEDFEQITEFIRMGALVPFEATLVTSQRPFAEAKDAALQNLSHLGYEGVIDVQLARSSKPPVTPLPIRLSIS